MVLITIIGLSIGYSAFNTDLSISGEAKVLSMYAKPKILYDNGGREYIESKETPDFNQVAMTDEGMFATEDDDGTSYYFRGAVENNWLYFAGFYWRIIRINGDGSLRLIYSGTSTNTTGSNSQIKTSAFNSNYNRSEYVGLKYTSGQQHGQNTNSIILGELNAWYQNSLQSYADDIDSNVGFCSDREMANGYEWSSEPSSTIYYAGYGRLVKTSSNVNPTFKCSNGSDKLKIPVGLITADEVIMAGLSWSESATSNYLYTGEYYWTMSPCFFYVGSNSWANMFRVDSSGRLSNNNVDIARGMRPVINLKASTMLSGDGTKTNPYKVVNTA